MIELIFIIVIIGILASVAIPKLMGNRDDAKKVVLIANTKTCVSDIMAAYTAKEPIPPLATIRSCRIVNSEHPSAVTVNADKVVVTGIDPAVDGLYRYKGYAVSL